MIAACPECRTQYRVEPQRLSEEGVRLRCTRCQTIFRVRAPQTAPAPAPSAAPAAAPSPPHEAAPSPAAAETPEAPAPAEAPPSPAASDEPASLSERLVLVATPDGEHAKRWCEALRGWGLEAESAHDGVEAILKIHRRWPSAVVLDPQLPKMFGFQVCEVIKRNAALRRIGVVLIGAIHHPQRYRRTPSELYGADAYVEEPDLPEALAPILRDLGLPLGPVAQPAPASEPSPASAPEPPSAPTSDSPTIPPPVPPEATMPPAPPPEATMPPVPPPEATMPPAPPAAEPEPAVAEAAPAPEEPSFAPSEITIPPAVPEPAAAVAEPAGPAIGSPEYDVVDPDAEPLGAAEPEPAPLMSPELEADVMAEPEPLATAPEPEPVAPTPEPAPAPVAPTPEPAPAPVAPALEPAPAPVAPAPPAPEPVAAAPEPAPIAPPEPAPAAAPEPVAAVPEPAASEPPPAPQPAPAAEPAADPEVEQAERLARIIISDVVLYNEEKFRAACAAGNVLEALEGDMADGRAHFASRVPEHVRNSRDFLADELIRVAKSRGLM